MKNSSKKDGCLLDGEGGFVVYCKHMLREYLKKQHLCHAVDVGKFYLRVGGSEP